MLNVTIRQLQIFKEAAQVLSFARVAEKLNLSPAAVSFQIKQIESATGFALFERVGRKVSLTEAGGSLLGYAKLVLEALHDADQTMMALKGVTGGRVTLGLVSTAKYIVPHILMRFQSAYPPIAITIRDGNRREIIAALVKGEIDLAIMGRPPPAADVVSQSFAAHPSVIIAAPSHRLAAQRKILPASLANERFVVREEGSGTRALLDDFLHIEGILPSLALSSSSNETIKQAVMAGMGIALISKHTIGLEEGLGLLKVLPVSGFPLMRSWYVAHRASMPLLPIHSRLKTFLIEEGQAIIDALERSYAASPKRKAAGRAPSARQPRKHSISRR